MAGECLSIGHSERGSASLLAMGAIAATGFLFYRAPEFSLHSSQSVVYYSLIAILGIIAICTSGCALHTIVLGGNPRSVLRGKIRAFDGTIRELRDRLWYYETVSKHRQAAFTPQHLRRLSQLGYIMGALETRLIEIKTRFKQRSEEGVLLADELFSKQVSVVPNYLNDVIASEYPPDAPLETWISRINEQMDSIERELKKKRLLA